VIEWSLNGTTWNDAGSLIDRGRTYNGIINAFTNPLNSRLGFVRQSVGYTGSRLNLDGLAGFNVHFRWRVGTDASLTSLGWLIDNVRIYSCAGAPTGEVIQDGGFPGSTAGWTVFDLPMVPQGIVWDTAGDRFNYYRPPGSTH
jgi:hypothetical protein